MSGAPETGSTGSTPPTPTPPPAPAPSGGGWLDKAKAAAMKAAGEAQKLASTAAEKAKHADYGAMLEKTKSIANAAADEAKKAAAALSKEGNTSTSTTTPTAPGAPTTQASAPTPATTTSTNPDYQTCIKKLENVEALLREIKQILK